MLTLAYQFASMKKHIFTILIYSLFSTYTHAQQLSAMFNYSVFYSLDEPFLETYISIDARSIVYKKIKEKLHQGELEIKLQLEKEGAITYSDRYRLLSPELHDTSSIAFKFIDQQRIPINNGQYTLTLSIHDINTKQDPLEHQQLIAVYSNNENTISDIELVSEFSASTKKSILTKSGYDLVPSVSHYYPTDISRLSYYLELYNLREKCVIQTSLKNSNGQLLTEFTRTKVLEKSKVTPILESINIENLPSGNYTITYSLLDENQNILNSKEVDIIRLNQNISPEIINKYQVEYTFVKHITNKDTLKKYLNYLYPIQTPIEELFIKNQIQYDDIKLMQKFFYGFWKNRNALAPDLAWNNYKKLVSAVNNSFSNGQFKGYLTDMGRIYLKYGPPNTRNKEHFSNTQKPFEVWHYHSLGNQRNCTFVFTNRNLGNNMDLVLSNVEGENTNFEWLMRFSDEMNDPHFDLNSPLDYFVNPK